MSWFTSDPRRCTECQQPIPRPYIGARVTCSTDCARVRKVRLQRERREQDAKDAETEARVERRKNRR